MKALRTLSALLSLVLVGCASTAPPVTQKESAVPEVRSLPEPKPVEVVKVVALVENLPVAPEPKGGTVTVSPPPTVAKRVEKPKAVVKRPSAAPVKKPAPERQNSAQLKPEISDQGLKPKIASEGVKLPQLPVNAVPLIPVLRTQLDKLWPEIPFRSFMGAKIEQETCLSLTHKKCWSSRAELKTSREYGFGLGQITIIYRKDGTERFNVWKELVDRDPVLRKHWTWENRFDPELQIRAAIIKSKSSFHAVRFPVANDIERMAFTAATYNSGSVLIDRKICIDTPGCDPSRWFGNVEKYSTKSRVVQPGYGKSFHDIRTEYPRNILIIRRPKYVPWLDD